MSPSRGVLEAPLPDDHLVFHQTSFIAGCSNALALTSQEPNLPQVRDDLLDPLSSSA